MISYRVVFSNSMLGLEDWEAMEEMHVLLGGSSRVENWSVPVEVVKFRLVTMGTVDPCRCRGWCSDTNSGRRHTIFSLADRDAFMELKHPYFFSEIPFVYAYV